MGVHTSSERRDERLPNRTADRSAEFVRRRLSTLFPNDAETLLKICLAEAGTPLYFGHVDILAELVPNPIERSLKDDLCIGYTLLSAYYILLDSLVDGHLDEQQRGVYLTHLLGGALLLFRRVCDQVDGDKARRIEETIRAHISENARSVLLEIQFRAQPLIAFHEEEYASIVGRANSALLLYRTLRILSGGHNVPDITALLGDLLFYTQLGDDLADWKEDYLAERWTSFLRSVFISKGRVMGLSELEEQVYLGGLPEKQLADIINGLSGISTRLRSIYGLSSNLLQELIKVWRERFLNALYEVLAIKVSRPDQS